MFKAQVSKLTDSELKKRNRLCLGIAIGFLLAMIVALIWSLIQISNQNENATFIALSITVSMPIIFLPLLYSSALSAEIKKRKTSLN